MGALSDILTHGSEALNWAASAHQLQDLPEFREGPWIGEVGAAAVALRAAAALGEGQQTEALRRLAGDGKLLRRIELLRGAARAKLASPDKSEDATRRRRATELDSLLRLLQRHAS